MAYTEMTQAEVDQKLLEHKMFLAQNVPHWENKRADFSNCILNGIDFHGADLSKAVFVNSILKDCDMSECNLTFAKCSFLSGERNRFVHTDLNHTMMDFSHLVDCNFSGAEFRTTSLYQGKLLECEFTDTYFLHSNLYLADMDRGHFLSSTFEDATCTNAGFTDTEFKDTEFIDTDLLHANFEGAKLTDVVMNRTDATLALFGDAKIYSEGKAGKTPADLCHELADELEEGYNLL